MRGARSVFAVGSFAVVIAACTGLGEDDEPEKKSLRASPGFDWTDEGHPMAGACPDLSAFGKDGCAQCLRSKCQPVCVACNDDASCSAGARCMKDCESGSDVGACYAGCVRQTSEVAREKLIAIVGNDGCALLDCAQECSSTKRSGDACASKSECLNEPCNDFCEHQCTSDDECFRTTDRRRTFCVPAQGGKQICFPSCTRVGADAECSQYGTDYACREANGLDGAKVNVCSLPLNN